MNFESSKSIQFNPLIWFIYSLQGEEIGMLDNKDMLVSVNE